MKLSSKNIPLILELVKEYKPLFVLNMLVVVIGAVFEGVGIGMLLPVLESIEEGQKESDSVFNKVAHIVFDTLEIEYIFINLIIVFAILIIFKYIFFKIA